MAKKSRAFLWIFVCTCWVRLAVQPNTTNTYKNRQKLSAEWERNLHRLSQQEWGRQVNLVKYLSSCILYKHKKSEKSLGRKIHGRKITKSTWKSWVCNYRTILQVTLKGSTIHPSIAKSLEIIKEKFERLCLRDQDILGTPEQWNKVSNCFFSTICLF